MENKLFEYLLEEKLGRLLNRRDFYGEEYLGVIGWKENIHDYINYYETIPRNDEPKKFLGTDSIIEVIKIISNELEYIAYYDEDSTLTEEEIDFIKNLKYRCELTLSNPYYLVELTEMMELKTFNVDDIGIEKYKYNLYMISWKDLIDKVFTVLISYLEVDN